MSDMKYTDNLGSSQGVLYISERNLARRWDVGRSTIARLRATGRLRCFKPTAGRVCYRLSDVERYEQEQTTDLAILGFPRTARRLATLRRHLNASEVNHE